MELMRNTGKIVEVEHLIYLNVIITHTCDISFYVNWHRFDTLVLVVLRHFDSVW